MRFLASAPTTITASSAIVSRAVKLAPSTTRALKTTPAVANKGSHERARSTSAVHRSPPNHAKSPPSSIKRQGSTGLLVEGALKNAVRAMASIATPSVSAIGPSEMPIRPSLTTKESGQGGLGVTERTSPTDAFLSIPFHKLPQASRHSTITLAANLLLPFPIPTLISHRLLLHKRCQVFLADLPMRDLDQDLFAEFEKLLEDVRSALISSQGDHGGRGVLSSLRDPTWGLDPGMGLVSEGEARDHLSQEVGDMGEALVREVNQLVVIGMMKRGGS
ncbi:hypothetical protein HDU67_004753 [Dinochytrium kinnereticum]|nr:hypothetical protein HDU67_004753 [Dinochytrium kinnereticum]